MNLFLSTGHPAGLAARKLVHVLIPGTSWPFRLYSLNFNSLLKIKSTTKCPMPVDAYFVSRECFGWYGHFQFCTYFVYIPRILKCLWSKMQFYAERLVTICWNNHKCHFVVKIPDEEKFLAISSDKTFTDRLNNQLDDNSEESLDLQTLPPFSLRTKSLRSSHFDSLSQPEKLTLLLLILLNLVGKSSDASRTLEG